MAQTVTLAAGGVTSDANVTLTHAVSGGGYESVAPDDVVVTIVDVPENGVTIQVGVTVSDQTLSVTEGSSNTYEMVLEEKPTGDVTITVAVTDTANNDVSVDETSLTFTPDNWNTPQALTARAAHDDDAATDPVVGITHSVSGANYAGVAVPGVEVTIDEDDTAGVSVSTTTLTVPEGQSETYTVVLDTQPTGDVTVTVSGHSGTDITLSGDTLNADNELTFTSTNWDTAQTVSVTAAEDDDAAVDSKVTLAHAVSGTGEYASVTAGGLEVAITENDSPGMSIDPTALIIQEGGSKGYTVVLDTQPSADVTVAVSGHAGTDITLGGTTLSATNTLTFTPDNWSQAQTVTVTAGDIDEGTQVTLSHTVSGGDYGPVSAADVLVTILAIDEVNIRVGVTVADQSLNVPEGGSSTYDLLLDAQPAGNVTITIAVEDTAYNDVSVDETSLTFTPQTWNTPQAVTVRAAHDDDANQDPEVKITHAASGTDSQISIPNVLVTITEDDSAGVSIDPTALTVPEGQSKTYTVVLDSQPSADVTVTVSGHANTDITLSGIKLNKDHQLTFTSTNWDTAQTVTVAAAEDDDSVPTDPAVTLAHAVSGTGEYLSVTAAGLEVAITENDTAGVSIDPTENALTIVEGQSKDYSVVLATQPSANVTVTISGHSSTDINLSGTTLNSNNELTFTTVNWNQDQNVTVSAREDDDAAVDSKVTLAHAVSGTGEYASVTAGGLEVAITENDTAGVSIDPAALTVLEWQSNNYTVVLDTQPTADVTVTISGYTNTDITPSSASLTFTTADWNVAQTVMLTAGGVTADTEVTLSHVLNGGDYDSVAADDAVVTVVDVPEGQVTIQVGVTVVEQSLAVPEGGSQTYKVLLGGKPTGEVTVAVTVEDAANNDVSSDETSLAFTMDNWNTPQTVTVRAAHDDDATTDPAVSITHSVSGANYAGVAVPGVEVTIDEDDTAGVSVSTTTLTVPEGQSETYTVVLDTQPSANVTVTVSGHSSTDITLSGDTLNADNELTFTSTNWNTAQTVTVTPRQRTTTLLRTLR